MLPSRPFRCSQRHQTHLHFFAGVITKDKRVLKGSKFTHWSPCIWKRKLSITPNSAPWFQPGVKFTQGEKSQHIIFHCTVFSSSLLTAKALSCSRLSTGARTAWLLFPPDLILSTSRSQLDMEQELALKVQTNYLKNPLSLHLLCSQGTYFEIFTGHYAWNASFPEVDMQWPA